LLIAMGARAIRSPMPTNTFCISSHCLAIAPGCSAILPLG
jgi:hypothetical protein